MLWKVFSDNICDIVKLLVHFRAFPRISKATLMCNAEWSVDITWYHVISTNQSALHIDFVMVARGTTGKCSRSSWPLQIRWEGPSQNSAICANTEDVLLVGADLGLRDGGAVPNADVRGLALVILPNLGKTSKIWFNSHHVGNIKIYQFAFLTDS